MRWLRTVFCLLVAVAAVSGCGSASDEAEPATGSGPTVLHRGNGGEPGTLDPQLAEDVHAFRILEDVYEGLVSIDASGRIAPGAAARWSVSADGLEYRFELDENARWSNGERVVAGDFVRAFAMLAAADTGSAYEFLLEPVDNFSVINAGAAEPEALGVLSDDDDTLRIRLREPTPYWLSVLTMAVAYPRHASEAIGNGAYRVAERQVNGPVRLQRNPHYRAAEDVAVDEVVYYPITDNMAEYNRYRAGELDITATIPPAVVADARASMPGQTRIAPTLGLYYIAFDLSEAPFDDARVRKALAMAVDRERLVTVIGRGEVPAFGVVPPGVRNYDPAQFDWSSQAIDARREAAQTLLTDAGYGPKNRLSVRLTYDVGDVHERIALAVGDMWRAVGVAVDYDKKEWKYFLDTRERREQWDAMRFAWIGDYDDATTFLDIFRGDSPQNLPGYRNSDYDAALDAAASLLDAEKRAADLRAAETQLLTDHAIAPLYFYVSKHLVKPDVRGFEANILDRHPSRFLSVDRGRY